MFTEVIVTFTEFVVRLLISFVMKRTLNVKLADNTIYVNKLFPTFQSLTSHHNSKEERVALT